MTKKTYHKDLKRVIRIRVTEKQFKEIKEFCKKEKITVSQIARLGIRNYIHAK